MCILLATTESSEYPFILLSNRDEYFRRPTDNAKFRIINNTKVLCPIDLGRQEHGTWMGVDKRGKIAVLVNFREDDISSISDVSRGILPIDYLTSDDNDDDWYNNLEHSLAKRVGGDIESVPLRRVGGFSLLYGKLELKGDKIERLNIISNRGDKGSVFDGTESTIGLSNSLYYDPWEKVQSGKQLLSEAVALAQAQNLSRAQLVDKLFGVLTVDTFDKTLDDKSMKDKLMGLRSTIFVPPLDTHFEPQDMNAVSGKYYGTRTQTLILFDKNNQLHYYEKDIHYTDNVVDEPKLEYFNIKVQQ